MKFNTIFPNYKILNNNTMNMNELNDRLIRDICAVLPDGILIRARKYEGRGRLAVDKLLIDLCNMVSKYTSSDRTTNWGWEYIIQDYFEYIESFNALKFHRFMDFITEAVFTLTDEDDTIYEINELLEQHNIGYRLVKNSEKPWILANSSDVERLNEIIETLGEISLQAVEHIKQARVQLNDSDNLRARKDAIRDCLSATETVIKKITGEESYEKAAEYFRKDEDKWGPKFIIGDCINIWKKFHQEYKDIRHGDNDVSEISYEETLYYIDRILAFVNYIVKRAEVVGEIDA